MPDIDVTIKDKAGKSFQFSQTEELLVFIHELSKFWLEQEVSWQKKDPATIQHPNSLLTPIIQNVKNFDQFSTRFDKLIKQSNDQIEPTRWLNNQINTLLSRGTHFLQKDMLWHGHAFITNLSAAYEQSLNCGNDFFKYSLYYLTNNSQVEQQQGQLMAYEFAMQNESEIVTRRNAEQKSLTRLRSDLAEKNSELIKEVDQFKESFSTWRTEFESNVETFNTEKIETLDKEHKERVAKFTKFDKNSTSKITTLENTYENKLRLKKPAEYWEKQSKSFWYQGIMWLVFLFIVSTLAIFGIVTILLDWTEAKALELEIKNLQGAVFFAVLVSILAFFIKTLSRLAMSALHLQRDAKEREQLSYLYLALGNETDFDEESKRIVLQALFSRADTGLLSKDTSPTMPSVTDFLKPGKTN